jgi:hypothetical protein
MQNSESELEGLYFFHVKYLNSKILKFQHER